MATCRARYAWVREVRDLVKGEELTPFVRAAVAVDVTSSMTKFSTAGLVFINADRKYAEPAATSG